MYSDPIERYGQIVFCVGGDWGGGAVTKGKLFSTIDTLSTTYLLSIYPSILSDHPLTRSPPSTIVSGTVVGRRYG